MKIELSESVRIALRAMSRDEREKIQAWFDHLKNWETDDFVKANSVKLDREGDAVYMLRTTTDVRIFYTVADQTVVILNIASRQTILTSGNVAVGSSE